MLTDPEAGSKAVPLQITEGNIRLVRSNLTIRILPQLSLMSSLRVLCRLLDIIITFLADISSL